jgi:hypothetical protein
MSCRLLPLLLCCSLALGAAEIRQYTTRLDLGPDGTGRATAMLQIAGAPLEVVDIPVGFKASGFALADAPQGLQLETGPGGLRVTLPPAPGVATFSFTFKADGVLAAEVPVPGEKPTMPRTSLLLKFGFVNTKAALIKDYAAETCLPAGYRFQKINESSPKLRKSEVNPRVLLGRKDGRQTALIHNTDLKQGDGVSMTLEAVPARPSSLWFIAGAAIALLYLFLFRDMVKAKP